MGFNPLNISRQGVETPPNIEGTPIPRCPRANTSTPGRRAGKAIFTLHTPCHNRQYVSKAAHTSWQVWPDKGWGTTCVMLCTQDSPPVFCPTLCACQQVSVRGTIWIQLSQITDVCPSVHLWFQGSNNNNNL